MTGVINHAATQPPVVIEAQLEDAQQEFKDLMDAVLEYYGAEAQSSFVEVANPKMRVHLLTTGSGEPVLFFHGGDGEAADWAPLMAQLQDDLQLIGVDRPGFGLSDPFDYGTVDIRQHAGDFVVSLLDALGLEQATLAGGSMGGYFVLSAALDHPERVKRVILLGLAVGVADEAGEEMKQLCGTPGAAREFMRQAASVEAQHMQYEQMFHMDPRTLPEIYFRMRVAELNLPGTQDAWATLLTRTVDGNGIKPEMIFGDELQSLKAPVLIVWGENDMAPPAVGEKAARLIPDCRFVILPGCGHFPFLEQPEQTAQLIREFIAGE